MHFLTSLLSLFSLTPTQHLTLLSTLTAILVLRWALHRFLPSHIHTGPRGPFFRPTSSARDRQHQQRFPTPAPGSEDRTESETPTQLQLRLRTSQRSRSSRCGWPCEIHALPLGLGLHTLYAAYALLVRRPPNIFKALRLPLSAPIPAIQRALSLARYASKIPPTNSAENEHERTLLTRLAALDARALYAKHGHAALAQCAFCGPLEGFDYALWNVPGTLLAYALCAGVVGVVTASGGGAGVWGRWRGRVRGWAAGVLGAAFVGELGCVARARVEVLRADEEEHDGRDVNEGVVWYHDTLFVARHALLLVLPLALYALRITLTRPLRAPSSHAQPHSARRARTPTTQPTLASTQTSLTQTLTRLAALRHVRGAIMRVPEVGEAARGWWARERSEGRWVREDAGVWKVVEGMTGAKDGEREEEEVEGTEGRMRKWAREVVGALRNEMGVEGESEGR